MVLLLNNKNTEFYMSSGSLINKLQRSPGAFKREPWTVCKAVRHSRNRLIDCKSNQTANIRLQATRLIKHPAPIFWKNIEMYIKLIFPILTKTHGRIPAPCQIPMSRSVMRIPLLQGRWRKHGTLIAKNTQLPVQFYPKG